MENPISSIVSNAVTSILNKQKKVKCVQHGCTSTTVFSLPVFMEHCFFKHSSQKLASWKCTKCNGAFLTVNMALSHNIGHNGAKCKSAVEAVNLDEMCKLAKNPETRKILVTGFYEPYQSFVSSVSCLVLQELLDTGVVQLSTSISGAPGHGALDVTGNPGYLNSQVPNCRKPGYAEFSPPHVQGYAAPIPPNLQQQIYDATQYGVHTPMLYDLSRHPESSPYGVYPVDQTEYQGRNRSGQFSRCFDTSNQEMRSRGHADANPPQVTVKRSPSWQHMPSNEVIEVQQHTIYAVGKDTRSSYQDSAQMYRDRRYRETLPETKIGVANMRTTPPHSTNAQFMSTESQTTNRPSRKHHLESPARAKTKFRGNLQKAADVILVNEVKKDQITRNMSRNFNADRQQQLQEDAGSASTPSLGEPAVNNGRAQYIKALRMEHERERERERTPGNYSPHTPSFGDRRSPYAGTVRARRSPRRRSGMSDDFSCSD